MGNSEERLTDEGRDRRFATGVAAVFALVALLAALDLASDSWARTTLVHVALEGFLFLGGLAGLGWGVSRLAYLRRRERELAEETATLSAHLEASRREAEAFREEAAQWIDGLASAIDRQLDRWGLTPAEKDVALLLLKGLSHKEIAEVRHVGEATVRQQSRAIYKKAGLGGRHDLAAFFLEDLLVVSPEQRADASRGPRDP
ncbi:MAG: LuxR C-terminal-related transcriptional regulator [Polyangiales bacterium]